METIKQEVLEKIKNKEIIPRPRWFFSARNITFWIAFIVSILVGSVAFGVILFVVNDHDWTVYANLHQTFLQYLFASLPYFWIVWLVLFTAVSYIEFRNTKKGYHYIPYIVIFGSILISVLFGTGFYLLGIGEKTHNLFAEDVPYYRTIIFDRKGQWSDPERGLLSGTVVGMENPTQFLLRDWNGKLWQVTMMNVNSGNTIFVNPTAQVRIVGEQADSAIFMAYEIMPWRNDTRRAPRTAPRVMLTSSTRP